MNNKFFVGNINQFGFGTWNAGGLMGLKAPRINNKPNLFPKGTSFNQTLPPGNMQSTSAPKINDVSPYIPRTPIQPKYNAPKSIPFSQSMNFPKRQDVPYIKPNDVMNNTNKKYYEPEMLKLQILENKIKDMENETKRNKNDLQDLMQNDCINNCYEPSFRNNFNKGQMDYYNRIPYNQPGPPQPMPIYLPPPNQQEYDPNNENNPFKPTREERRQQLKKDLEKARQRLREDSSSEEEGDEEGEEEESEEETPKVSKGKKSITEPNIPQYNPMINPQYNPNPVINPSLVPNRINQPRYSGINTNLRRSSNYSQNVMNIPTEENNFEESPKEAFSKDLTKKLISPEEEAKIFINSIPQHVALKLQADNFKARENMNLLKANFREIKTSLENQLEEMELRQRINFETIKNILEKGGTKKLQQSVRNTFEDEDVDLNLVEENVPKFMEKIPQMVEDKIKEKEEKIRKEKNEELEEELRLIKEEQMKMKEQIENTQMEMNQQMMSQMIPMYPMENIQREEEPIKEIPKTPSIHPPKTPKNKIEEEIKYQSQREDFEREKRKQRRPSGKDIQRTPEDTPKSFRKEHFNTPKVSSPVVSIQKQKTKEKEKPIKIIPNKSGDGNIDGEEESETYNRPKKSKRNKNKTNSNAIFDHGEQEGIYMGNEVVNKFNLFPQGLLGNM
ncbi:MAG: hypothetical protein MJ252_00680 [archaeon]|nr:hypothetical protein [archaeon]